MYMLELVNAIPHAFHAGSVTQSAQLLKMKIGTDTEG